MRRAVLGLFLLSIGCGDSSGSGGNAGGAGGNDNVSSTASVQFQTCDVIGVCSPDASATDLDPARSCIECAVFGTAEVASDAGACGDEYSSCFGAAGDCTDGITECFGFYDCAAACDSDASGTIDDGPELDCYCTNEADPESGERICSEVQTAGSCLADFNAGLDAAFLLEDCLYGLAAQGVCTESCAL